MKIEHVDVWLVEGIKYNWTLLRITTEQGLTGLGVFFNEELAKAQSWKF